MERNAQRHEIVDDPFAGFDISHEFSQTESNEQMTSNVVQLEDYRNNPQVLKSKTVSRTGLSTRLKERTKDIIIAMDAFSLAAAAAICCPPAQHSSPQAGIELPTSVSVLPTKLSQSEHMGHNHCPDCGNDIENGQSCAHCAKKAA